MISKEELEERIKHNKPIWCYYVNEKVVEKINDRIYHSVNDEVLSLYDRYHNLLYYPLEHLYTTKREAMDYKNFVQYAYTSRTDRLPFVSWKEFKEGKEVVFSTPSHENISMYCVNYEYKGKNINKIVVLNLTRGLVIKSLSLSKQNYNKMYIGVCKKLFLGRYENE